MSLEQYNQLMSDMLNQWQTLAKLRTKLERRKKRKCFGCKEFRHLAHNCRKWREVEKGRPIPHDKFKVLSVQSNEVWYKRGSKSEETGEEKATMFQVLGGRTLQVGLSNNSSREGDAERKRGDLCGQTTKGAVKASISYMEKDVGVL